MSRAVLVVRTGSVEPVREFLGSSFPSCSFEFSHRLDGNVAVAFNGNKVYPRILEAYLAEHGYETFTPPRAL